MRHLNSVKFQKLALCVVSLYACISIWRWNKVVEPVVGTINRDAPLILYWDLPWGDGSIPPKHGETQGKCTISRDKKDLMKSKAVVFHHTTISKRDLPWKHYRNPEQVFIWWTAESPGSFVFMKHNLDDYDNFFNWTMTYRRDSDVTAPYFTTNDLLKSIEMGQSAIDDIISKKEKLSIIFTSNCWYTYGALERKKISDQLFDLGLNMERYGHCYRNSKLPRSSQKDVDGYIKKFKFYFAFENALNCRDYITEKFWNALSLGVVPVVWGTSREDYASAAPKGSFIHVDDFPNLNDLVTYLNYLDRNDTAYREYFRWREHSSVDKSSNVAEMDFNFRESPETLCDTLLRRWDQKQTIFSISNSFMLTNQDECLKEPLGNFYINKILDFFGWM